MKNAQLFFCVTSSQIAFKNLYAAWSNLILDQSIILKWMLRTGRECMYWTLTQYRVQLQAVVYTVMNLRDYIKVGANIDHLRDYKIFNASAQ